MDKQEKTSAKNYQVKLSSVALEHFNEITGYIAFINFQPLNAIKVGDEMFKTIDKIGLNPHAFKECKELPTKSRMYRTARCLSWIIVFKIVDESILVLGILHKSRRPSKVKGLRKVK